MLACCPGAGSWGEGVLQLAQLSQPVPASEVDLADHHHRLIEFWRSNLAPVFSMRIQETIQPQLRRCPSRCLQTPPHRRIALPLILTLPKWFPLITYCGRCGTFGSECHLLFFDECSPRFRELGWLSCADCTVRICGVQWRGAAEKVKVNKPQEILILLVARVAELADALDSGSSR